MSAKKFVDDVIRNYRVVVFSKSYCPLCSKAKGAIEKMGCKPGTMEVVELEERPDCEEIMDILATRTGARTVPRVFIKGRFYGGCDEVLAAAKNGMLAAALKDADAI